MSAAALEQFEGEKPTPEHATKAGCEIIRLADIDPKLRGRAVRMGDGWRPKTLYSKGRITKRQYAAACELVALYEAGFVAPIKGVSWGDRVDGGLPLPGGRGERMLDAHARYRAAMSRLASAQQAIVVAVVVEGRGVTDALKLPDVADRCWMPSARGDRLTAAGVLLAAALDSMADAFGL